MAAHPLHLVLWPSGLVGRVVLVLLAALVLEFAGSTLVYEQFSALIPSTESLDDLAGRLARTERALSALPGAWRDCAARELSGEGLQLNWSGERDAEDGPAARTPISLALLRGRLTRLRPELALHGLQLHAGFQQASGLSQNLLGTLHLDDGTTLRFAAERVTDTRFSVYEALLSTALFAGGVLLAAAMVVHTLAAPLRRLARVADTIGHGPPVHVADQQGPREVRQVAKAMNAMQSRIASLVRDHTETLAAVSHDLRTPIARMRLRVGLLDASDTASAMEADLAEIEQMITTVLAFLHGEGDPEPVRTVDLASILQTVVDDATDAGAAADYAGPDHCKVRARPVEIKRAFVNLVDNAVKYGGSARVSLHDASPPGRRAAVRVRVEDDGPGIPPAELERVLEPFRRVDTSRNPELGGMGLGLAIVRRAVERDGGSVVLSNRLGGGLRAEVVLPVG